MQRRLHLRRATGVVEPRSVRTLRATLWVGVVACALLAVLALGAHAGEYPLLSRPGIRAVASDVLPLLWAIVLNLVALEVVPTGRLRGAGTRLAVVGNVLLLAAGVRPLGPGAPPFPYLLTGVATLLVIGSLGCLAGRARPRPRAIPWPRD